MKKRYLSLAALVAVAVFSLGPVAFGQLFQAPTGPGGTWNVYELVGAGATFKAASAAANAAVYSGTPGRLVSINSALENAWVHRKAGFGDVWIGLTDREGAAPAQTDGFGNPTPQEAGSAVDKGWAWTSGEPVTFTAFGGGEPNDWNAGVPGEDAAHLRGDGLWNDNGGGFLADDPIVPVLRPGTSGAEPTPAFKYVIEYPVASASQVAGVDASVPGILPAPMPGPSGGAGYWGILEVRDVNTGGSIGSVVNNLLTSPPPASAKIFTGTSPKLDFTDPETNATGGPILGTPPIPYLSNTSADDNEIHAVAKGRIKVVEPGDYTIQVRSDDGFALKVHGANFTSVHGAGSLDIVDNSTIYFPSGTGDADTRGVINLAAGEYDVEFVWWEGGGGSFYEVTSAKGAYPNGGAAWLALGDPSIIPDVYTAASPVRLVAPANVIVGPNVPGDPPKVPATIVAVKNAILDPAAPRGTADNVMLIGGGDSPCCGRPSESLPASLRVPFPNGNGQDNFTAGVFGTMLVDDGDATPGETLQLTFGLFSDDGTALRIYGQDFTATGGDPNAVLVDIDGDMALVADFWTGNSNAYGLIELKEGTYGFESFVYEGGGGSALEIFVASGDKRGAYSHSTFSPLSINAEPIFVATGNRGLELVPEPSSLTLVGLGLLGLLGLRRRNG